ncbi:MAG: SDR family NAD(P)-dependent oxidoreductase [Bacteroidetes bacterium]|nr:MAG: SDR family NAD(P)-dependent oxidoreductase [Bacteroidota bacterium]
MSGDRKGMVAAVTGASRGIGRAVALHLAREGWSVALASRDAAALSDLAEEITAFGGTALPVPTDVTSEDSVAAMTDAVTARFGRFDALINNAGVGVFRTVAETATGEYDRMMNVNMKAVFLCCRSVIPVMSAQRRGDIVTIASLAGKNSFAGGAVYSASKWGIIGFSRSLMLEVRDRNIRVITLCPGSVNTGFADKERNDPTIIQPSDVAETVSFALSMPDRINVSEIDIRPSIRPR